jgi:hypothetical protein
MAKASVKCQCGSWALWEGMFWFRFGFPLNQWLRHREENRLLRWLNPTFVQRSWPCGGLFLVSFGSQFQKGEKVRIQQHNTLPSFALWKEVLQGMLDT